MRLTMRMPVAAAAGAEMGSKPEQGRVGALAGPGQQPGVDCPGADPGGGGACTGPGGVHGPGSAGCQPPHPLPCPGRHGQGPPSC